ncbi:type II secretion system minor pseudopilin GspK [Sandaracinobacter sp. RS1-74]|uniref:type II secretion system minor pseudopilin GspK n=1 Tax=Sandaracinobacteroides sayramensis TaxID=2913411 RepID=UPI001EDBF1FC|nr:type II secretion system minor pseudopilin GspK [Sandaracinobacteroides sayramensis]
MKPRIPPSERGAALLAVLAMVMLLAGFASLGLSRLRAATDRITDSEARSEAQILANSGTAAALGMIHLLKAQSHRNPKLMQAPIRIPLGEGQVELRFSDAGNCFNLNSLARQQQLSAGTGTQAQSRAADFARLLAATGIPQLEASTIAQATASRLSQTGMLWADASEWVTVPGVTAQHWQMAGALLCALPNREVSAMNVNSLRPEQAPLLASMGLGADEARRALANRPEEGWTSANQFWDQASSSGTPDTAGAEMVGTSSRWIELKLLARTPRAAAGRELLLDTMRQPARVATSRWLAVEESVQEERP